MQHRSAHSTACHARWHAGTRRQKNKRNLCNTVMHIQKPATQSGLRGKNRKNRCSLRNTDLHTQEAATRNSLRGNKMEKQTQPLHPRSTLSQACYAKGCGGRKLKNRRSLCNTDLHTQKTATGNKWKHKRSLCNTDLHTQRTATRNGMRGQTDGKTNATFSAQICTLKSLPRETACVE